VYCDIVTQETEDGTRVVHESEHFLVVSPWAPRFPFETWIVPKTHASHAETLSHADIPDLAATLQSTLQRIDSALERPPYNLVLHSAPIQDPASHSFHWHIEIIPKLMHVAGFEWGSGFYINPTPPEESATFLREASFTPPDNGRFSYARVG
jgi:UDPglucose--hexose-1-phosphate uridylyltransferase